MKANIWHIYVPIFLFLPPSLSAQQSPKDSITLIYYFSRAIHNMYTQPDSSFLYCDAAIDLAIQSNQIDKQIEGLLLKANVALVNLKMKTVKDNIDLATTYLQKIKNKESYDCKLLELERKDILALYQNYIGRHNRALITSELAIEEIESLSKQNKNDSTYLTKFYLGAGFIYNQKGDYEKALNCYFKASHWDGKPHAQANYIASIYVSKNEFEKAKEYYQSYISSQKNLPTALIKKGMLSYTYRNLAEIHLKENNTDMAIHYLSESLKYNDKKDASYPYTYFLFGKAHLASKEYELAIQKFEYALEHKQNAQELDKHFQYADYYIGIGDVFYEKGDLKLALTNYQIAMTNLVTDFNEKNYTKNPKLDNLDSPKELLEVFEKKNKCLIPVTAKRTKIC